MSAPLADPELLKWWHWMERRFGADGRIVATAKGVPAKYRGLPADMSRERTKAAKARAGTRARVTVAGNAPRGYVRGTATKIDGYRV